MCAENLARIAVMAGLDKPWRSLRSAAMISASVAVCHSSRSCSAFSNFMMVVAGILKRDEMATAGQWYRIFERLLPARRCHQANSSAPASVNLM
jgi:hypothetical protein